MFNTLTIGKNRIPAQQSWIAASWFDSPQWSIHLCIFVDDGRSITQLSLYTYFDLYSIVGAHDYTSPAIYIEPGILCVFRHGYQSTVPFFLASFIATLSAPFKLMLVLRRDKSMDATKFVSLMNDNSKHEPAVFRLQSSFVQHDLRIFCVCFYFDERKRRRRRSELVLNCVVGIDR